MPIFIGSRFSGVSAMLDNINSGLMALVQVPDRPRMLIVDDQPANVQALYAVFSADFQVFMATKGDQAMRIALLEQPDIILLDVVMPDMDGHEICRQLKLNNETADIPVLFVTAQTDPDEETYALQVGGVDFIQKPINPSVVKARVKTHLTLKRQTDLLKQMVFIDGLTGIFNRRYFDDRLMAEWGRASRNQEQLSLILIDVDHFKQFNDRYGHQSGDDCLRQVASALKRTLWRPCDVVARYGGEEFACILPDTDLQGAMQVASRLGEAVMQCKIPHADSVKCGFVTVSLGVGVHGADCPGEMAHLLALADDNLYRAKRAGRAQAQGSELDTVLECREAKAD